MPNEMNGLSGVIGECQESAKGGPGMKTGIHRPRLGASVTEEVGREHAIAMTHRGNEWSPYVMRSARAVGENDGHAGSGILVCECSPIHHEGLHTSARAVADAGNVGVCHG